MKIKKVVTFACFAIALVTLAPSTQAKGINRITRSTSGSVGLLGLAPDTQESLRGRPLPPAGYVDLRSERQIMKLDLLPNGQRTVAPAILSYTGSDCPNPLSQCNGPDGTCTWNKVGPLP